MKRSTIIESLAVVVLSGVIVVSFISVCGYVFAPGCPLIVPREVCLGVDEALLAELEPYVADWATRPAEETKQERDEFAKQSETVWFIQVVTRLAPVTRQKMSMVEVYTEVWFDWYHGYLYVPNGTDPGNTWRNGTLIRISEHWYLFGYND